MKGFKSFANAAVTIAGIELTHRIPYCSKSPHASSSGNSFVVIQDATESRATTDSLISTTDS
jgi:hypothetical protein